MIKKIGVLCLVAMMVAACGKSGKVSYLAFKADEKDRWGLISVDGDVLFENEFQEEPTAVLNDRFFVRNSSGLYECYIAEEKPKKIGKEYVSVTDFIEDVAPVVEKNQPISFIDKEGETVLVFDRYNNKAIVGISNFSDGLAFFKTEDGLYGYVNTKGKVTISPSYKSAWGFSEDRAFVVDKDDKLCVINKNGDKLFNIDTRKTKILNPKKYSEGLITFISNDDESGCLNAKGEKVIKESSKYKHILSFSGEVAPYYDGHFCGLINKKGESVIRAKYQSVGFCTERLACVQDQDKWGIVNYENEIVCPFDFDAILPFYNDGKYAFAKNHDYYVLIDEAGKELNKKEYYKVSPYDEYDVFIESDYLDYPGVLNNELAITMNGVDGLTFDMQPELVYNQKDHENKSSDYSGADYIVHRKRSKYFDITFITRYPLKVVDPIVDRRDSGWGYQEDEITGYGFNNDQKVSEFDMRIEGIGKAKGNYRDIMAAVENQLKTLGFQAIKDKDGGPVKFMYQGKCKVLMLMDPDDNDDICVAYSNDRSAMYQEFWESIKNADYSQKKTDSYDAEDVERATAESIRVADSIAAAEAAAAEEALDYSN